MYGNCRKMRSAYYKDDLFEGKEMRRKRKYVSLHFYKIGIIMDNEEAITLIYLGAAG